MITNTYKYFTSFNEQINGKYIAKTQRNKEYTKKESTKVITDAEYGNSLK